MSHAHLRWVAPMWAAWLLSLSSTSSAATFVLEKQGTNHSIDGNNGATQGQALYLWSTSLSNVNQNWVQLNRGGGYYSYRKQNTNLCMDGQNGGARRQAILLEPCSTNNHNQHWRKVKVFNGTEIYRLEKRNAPGFSIDGNGGAANQQGIYLWNSNSSNVNQQWDFIRTDQAPPPPTSGCSVPHDVLPMDYWKITIPFTSASGGSGGNTNKAAEVDWPNISTYERSPYFTNSGCNYVQFRAHVGGATTNGSGYPRSELREMNYRGSETSWSSGSGTHSMEVDLRVTALPPVKDHITVMQIHDGGDDVITFRLEGSKLFLEVNGSDGPVATSNYTLGTRVRLKFVVSNNQTRCYFNGSLFHTHNESYSGAYFKTGAYVQSACSGSKDVPGESCSSYGEVEIFDIDLSHN
ncbi:MAG: polysaccharide lyase family 7 protein [Myxococcota bacterium]